MGWLWGSGLRPGLCHSRFLGMWWDSLETVIVFLSRHLSSLLSPCVWPPLSQGPLCLQFSISPSHPWSHVDSAIMGQGSMRKDLSLVPLSSGPGRAWLLRILPEWWRDSTGVGPASEISPFLRSAGLQSGTTFGHRDLGL